MENKNKILDGDNILPKIKINDFDEDPFDGFGLKKKELSFDDEYINPEDYDYDPYDADEFDGHEDLEEATDNDSPRLVDKNGKEIKVGDKLVDFRGEEATVTGWLEPRHAGSTGRVSVKDDKGFTMDYFPGVYDLKWVNLPWSKKEECIKEDTVKKDGKWVNKGKEGTHGEFRTKKAADAQRKAMFANGYRENLEEEFDPKKLLDAIDHISPQDWSDQALNIIKAVLEEKPENEDEVYDFIHQEVDSSDLIYYAKDWKYLQDRNLINFKVAIQGTDAYDLTSIAMYYLEQECYDLYSELSNYLKESAEPIQEERKSLGNFEGTISNYLNKHVSEIWAAGNDPRKMGEAAVKVLENAIASGELADSEIPHAEEDIRKIKYSLSKGKYMSIMGFITTLLDGKKL